MKENQAITVYRPAADEGAGDITKIRFGTPDDQKDQFLAISDIFFIFLFFFRNIKFIYSAWHGPQSVQFS